MPSIAELVFENTSDAVVQLGPGLQIEAANSQAALLYRRPVRELVGMGFAGLSTDLDVAGLQSAAEGRIPRRMEICFPALFAWHSVLAVPMGEGRTLVFSRDVTDRVRREQEEATLAAVRRVIEDIPLCVTITRGSRHRIQMANRLARALVGFRPVDDELVESVLPEAKAQGFIDMLDRVYESGDPVHIPEMPMRWRPLPGAEMRESFFDITYQPIFSASGTVDGIIHLGADVTDKVDRRAAIERLSRERSAILEQLSEGVIVTDATGRITFVNAAAEAMHGTRLLGVAPEDYSSAYRLLTDEGHPYPSAELPLARAVLHGATSVGVVWRIARPDGSVVRVRGNAKPVYESGGQVVACVLTMVPDPEPPTVRPVLQPPPA